MPRFLLTTVDNPFDPFTQFDDWNQFDMDKGYYTCAYLARIAITSYEISEEDQEKAINDAVDEIVRMNLTGIYKKVEEKEASEGRNEAKTG